MAKAATKASPKAAAKPAAKTKAPVKAAAKSAAKSAAKGQSKFVWYDVMTTDMKAAEKFYRAAIGWGAMPADNPSGPYTVFSMGTTMVGGLMPIPEDARKMGTQPAWMGYIGVPDTDAFCKKVVAAGGAIHKKPTDIPGVGRFAVAADPGGAGFLLFTPNTTEQPAAVSPNATGRIGWHDLRAGNLDAAWNFYSKLFGWTKSRAIDMGPMGVYQIFAIDGVDVGGMMTKTPDIEHAHWLYYFNVNALDAAVTRVTKGKGRITRPAHEVPGGQWIAHCTDPHGAAFALVAPKR